MKRWFLAIILAFVVLVPVGYLWYNWDKAQITGPINPIAVINFEPEVKNLEEGVELRVLACQVYDGYRFALVIEGRNRIVAHLAVATKEEATSRVVEILNSKNTKLPSAKLLRKVGDYWIVELNLTRNAGIEGEVRTSMVELLRSENLILYSVR